MYLIYKIDKFLKKLLKSWRKKVFIYETSSSHRRFELLGNVHLVNRNVTLGKGVIIYPGVCFFGDGPIVIGDNTAIGNNVVIYSSREGGVHIGRDCAIAANCYIIDCDHGIEKGRPIRTQGFTIGEVRIGNDVWLGAGVKVLKGVTLGDGAVIGAQSVVVSSQPEDSIAVGVPCKVVKYRSFIKK